MYRLRNEDGAATIEFALIAPLLLMLVVAVMEFGQMYNTYQGLQAAAREGARLGSIDGQTTGNVSARVNAALAGVVMSDGAATVTPAVCSDTSETVTVTVSAPVSIDIPFYDGDDAWDISAAGTFRCE